MELYILHDTIKPKKILRCNPFYFYHAGRGVILILNALFVLLPAQSAVGTAAAFAL